jgi:7,8-dihydropterin-6-yl-methyl-4-(beta-D-ribofuranosyl)aminobenzene 5'-phosphate synthase
LEELRSVKVTTLADNFVQESGFLGQWGLSFLLDIEDARGRMHKVIFDTGAVKEGLLYNIQKLKLNLSDLEYIVLSHGHADHTATTVELLKKAKRGVKVVAHPHLYLPKFSLTREGKRRAGGLPKGERLEDIRRVGGQLITTEESFELLPGACTTGEIPRVTHFETVSPPPSGGKRLTVIDGKAMPDLILDDQAIVMNLKKLGPIVITGCAHSGIINTLQQARKISNSRKIYGVIGGFHLIQRRNPYINRTVKELRNFSLQLISPCHCTGFRVTSILHQAFSKAFVLNFSGRIIRTGKVIKPRIV